jgi:hypothetical protein
MKNIKKTILFLGLTLFSILIQAQIKSEKWPSATVEYYKPVNIFINGNITPYLGPANGIYYGFGGTYHLNKFYIEASTLQPILDESFIFGGPKSRFFSLGGEFVFSRKVDYENVQVVIERNIDYTSTEKITTTTYRDYLVRYPTEKTLRFGAATYNGSAGANFLNVKLKGDKNGVPVIIGSNGGMLEYGDATVNTRTAYIYLGYSKKSLEFYQIEMSDYVGKDITKSMFSTYVDLIYGPYIHIENSNLENSFKTMPFGLRVGMELYKTTGKYLGRYIKIETGILPGVGVAPCFLQLTVGASILIQNHEIIGTEIQ